MIRVLAMVALAAGACKDKPQAAPSPGEAIAEPATWTAYPGDGFTVHAPQAPEVDKKPAIPNQLGPLPGTTYIHYVPDRAPGALYITVLDLGTADPAAAFAKLSTGVADQFPNGALASDKEIEL